MKRKLEASIAISILLALASCGDNSEEGGENGNQLPNIEFAKGADISWVTEFESKGYKFYDSNNFATECTQLMQNLGFNACRYRVWVNPEDGWCNKEDVLVKAKRAQDLGMGIMIDFHYSDWWADPGKQVTPAAWSSYNVEEMTEAVAQHTEEVLNHLKNNGVSNIMWVQVGNETNTGMIKPLGEVNSSNKGYNFIKFANAAYDVIRKIYPQAKVILHHSNAQDLGRLQWFFNIMKAGGARYDMIGLSLYPSYWDEKLGKHPDWKPYTIAAVNNFKTMHETFGKDIMLVEFGMPEVQPEESKAALEYILENSRPNSWFKGVFYWEPESEDARNGYDYGAFHNGRPTIALDPFRAN